MVCKCVSIAVCVNIARRIRIRLYEVVAPLLPVAAKPLPGLPRGQLHRSPPSHPPVTPFPRLPSIKLSLPTPPSFFLPTARLLLYPHFFLHSNSEICFFLGVRPLHQHPPLVSPTLLLDFFFFCFSPSLTLCFACALSICLSLSVHACFVCSPVSPV